MIGLISGVFWETWEILKDASVFLIFGFLLARLGQPDGISPSRMAEMLEVDKAGPKVRC
jgi:hypothetical protein